MSDEILTSLPMRAAESLQRPQFTMPAGACDAHMHVFGPADRYPHVPKPHYTLPDGELGHYLRLMPVLGIERFVIVQPSFYGTDNSCLLQTLAVVGDQARGVVMFEPGISDAELDRFHEAGVRAVRLDLFKRAHEPLAAIQSHVKQTAARVERLGWHLQFYVPGYVVRELIPFLATLQVDFVIDHMGYMLEEDGLQPADFRALLELTRSGRGWLKLSGPYRIAKDKGYRAVEHIARQIVDAAPGRAIWGSDWPHIPNSQRDTGELLNLMQIWAPDAPTRQHILVDNPARLFGFEAD
jgi:predicted TIM-barrel fold metal-dependent hydrolase